MKIRATLAARLRKKFSTMALLHLAMFGMGRAVQIAASTLRSTCYRRLYNYGKGFNIAATASIAHPRNCEIGTGCRLESGCRTYSELYDGHLNVGDNCRFGREAVVDYTGGLTIGSNVVFSEGVMCFSHSHGLDPNSPPVPIGKRIESDVWIGAGAILTEGAQELGHGAVVAAGSVVTRNVAAGMVVAGNPARPIRTSEKALSPKSNPGLPQ